MKRLQLILFLDAQESSPFEDIREKYNPIQHGLIDCHITLCREDELLDLNQVKINLQNLKFLPLQLEFGEPQRFSDGKGVLLPVLDETEQFQILRNRILKDIIEHPRVHKPHLTLMHPRNSTCTDVIFEEIMNVPLPSHDLFKKVSLIQQLNEEKWEILEQYPLG